MQQKEKTKERARRLLGFGQRTRQRIGLRELEFVRIVPFLNENWQKKRENKRIMSLGTLWKPLAVLELVLSMLKRTNSKERREIKKAEGT
ncbi:hypothetical protein H5410_012487 [Solanum commersonii]|uniref:Uncharacterized protein n=1 Tax=Solanum commersonii TaxID=4109 RepID=A0A9J6ARP2_SOLCO|nr:hypothetical protein H5410_012487 [Solanum commersonii]